MKNRKITIIEYTFFESIFEVNKINHGDIVIGKNIISASNLCNSNCEWCNNVRKIIHSRIGINNNLIDHEI